jgi:hypothetical protein
MLPEKISREKNIFPTREDFTGAGVLLVLTQGTAGGLSLLTTHKNRRRDAGATKKINLTAAH